jgi:hypothetical protein
MKKIWRNPNFRSGLVGAIIAVLLAIQGTNITMWQWWIGLLGLNLLYFYFEIEKE